MNINQKLLKACKAALEDGEEYRLSEAIKQQLREAIHLAENPIAKIHWMASAACSPGGVSRMKRQLAIRLPQPLNQWIEHQAELKEKSLNRTIVHYLEISRSADLLGTKCIPPIHVFRDETVCVCGKKVVSPN